MIDVAEKIIVALDCDVYEARELAKQLQGSAVWLKVGMTLFYREGPAIVRELKQQGFNVFVDLKLHDIPHQVRGAARSVTLAGADMLTVHASGGLQMMEQAKAGAMEGAETTGYVPTTLSITVLTSIDQQVLAQIGVAADLPSQVSTLARLAQQAGLDGVVSSAQEAAKLRQELGQQAVIVTPGVRPAKAETQDQQRVATPKQAFAAGSSYLVIGRPITEAANPRQAFLDIVRSVEE